MDISSMMMMKVRQNKTKTNENHANCRQSHKRVS